MSVTFNVFAALVALDHNPVLNLWRRKKNIIESINLSNTSGTLCWKSIALVQSSHWSSGRSVDAIGVLSLLSSMGEDALLFLDAISLQPTASIINLLFWGVAKKHRFVC